MPHFLVGEISSHRLTNDLRCVVANAPPRPPFGRVPSLIGFGYTKTKGHIWLAPVGLAKRRKSVTLYAMNRPEFTEERSRVVLTRSGKDILWKEKSRVSSSVMKKCWNKNEETETITAQAVKTVASSNGKISK